MTARPFHPSMNRRRRELPGWVLALVALLVVVATAAVEGSSPGVLAAFFHVVGQVALVLLIAIVVVVIAGLWLAVLVYGWRHMDGER